MCGHVHNYRGVGFPQIKYTTNVVFKFIVYVLVFSLK